MADYSKHKERKPEDTIYEIQGILNRMGLFPVLDWGGATYKGVRSNRVTLYPTSLGTNGKGTDELYATASGYAELMERMNNRLLTLTDNSDDLRAETGFREFPDEKDMTPAEILREADPFTLHALEHYGAKDPLSQLMILRTLASLYGEDNKTLPCVPFADPEGDRVRYLPLELVYQVAGSNGMAAGNTLEEAMVQGLSEIFERAASREVVTGNAVPPEIPDEALRKYSFYSVIEQIRKEGRWRVTLYDCSLGKGYPVAGICITDLINGTFGMNLGAHPSFAVAVERTLTEAFQGRNTRAFTSNCRAGSLAEARHPHNVPNVEKIAVGVYPMTLFTDKPDWEYDPQAWARWEGMNNREFLAGMLQLLHRDGLRPLVRDTSFLGFPSCFIVVPGFSELFAPDDLGRHQLNTAAAVRKVWNHFPDLTEEEEDKLLRLILFKQGSELEDQIGMISLRPLSNAYRSEKIAAWLSLKRGAYQQAARFFVKTMQGETKAEERLRLYALSRYAAARANGLDAGQAQALIRKLFREDTAERVCADTGDLSGVMRREFRPLKCFDCAHCEIAGKDCDYPAQREVLLKICKAMKAENTDQEALLEKLKALTGDGEK